MKEKISDRLKQFAESQAISVNQFERLCGLSQGYVGHVGYNIMPDKLEKITKSFPILNTTWLLVGEGEMLRPTNIATKYVNGDGNVMVNGNSNNVSNGVRSFGKRNVDCDKCKDMEFAQREIEHLREMLAEKERMIQILLNK